MTLILTGSSISYLLTLTAIPKWNENYFYKWGYARVEAVNATYLDVRTVFVHSFTRAPILDAAFSNHAVNCQIFNHQWKWVEATSGTVMDHITITQSADWNSQPWVRNSMYCIPCIITIAPCISQSPTPLCCKPSTQSLCRIASILPSVTEHSRHG